MSINHGIRVSETATGLVAPIVSTAGLQVVFGTAPVNLAKDPYAVTNKIVTAYSFTEAAQKLGYSDDFEKFTLCQSMDATFRVKNVAPVIFINVLDPAKHKKSNADKTYNLANGSVTLDEEGILLDTLVVKDYTSTTTYVLNEDYVATFNDDGLVVISAVDGGAMSEQAKISVTSDAIDPTAVTKEDIIGGVNVSTQTETGLELIRKVYPKTSLTPGLISAPGWSHDATVAAVIQAKCENINSLFSCQCLIDIDTTEANTYDKVKEQKEAQGVSSKHAIACWPLIKIGDKTYYYSAILSALTAYSDASHNDVPYWSPSNQETGATSVVLADDTEVDLDLEQANMVNSFGVCTLLNMNGWKSWGNYTAAYPSTTDVKDMFICCRRMLSWWENSFILTFWQKVDNPTNYRLIKSICDTENIRANSYKAQNMIAGLNISFNENDNPATEILNGHIKFKTYYAFFAPAQDIENDFEFDPTILTNALLGGES